MSENNSTNNEHDKSSLAAIMGHDVPFFEATIRRTAYSKIITVPKKYAVKHHLNDGRRVHVYIVPIDDSLEISGGDQ